MIQVIKWFKTNWDFLVFGSVGLFVSLIQVSKAPSYKPPITAHSFKKSFKPLTTFAKIPILNA